MSHIDARSTTPRLRWLSVPFVALALVMTTTSAAGARGSGEDRPSAVVLTGATSAEGIAPAGGSTFYAGDLFAGDIYRGSVRTGRASLFIDAPAGRQAVGMKFSRRSGLLYVAGGFTGQAYVYDTRTGATVASYQFGTVGDTVINDVILTRRGAYFTDSRQGKLFLVPIDRHGRPGPSRILTLSGPAADTASQFNLNGIEATQDGKTLLVAHSGNGEVYRVDADTGTSAKIAGVTGIPSVDGLVLDDNTLWAVLNSNQVVKFTLNRSLTRGVVEKTITSPLFQTTATAALFENDTLGVVNAKFDTGFPPTAAQYEVVLVDA